MVARKVSRVRKSGRLKPRSVKLPTCSSVSLPTSEVRRSGVAEACLKRDRQTFNAGKRRRHLQSRTLIERRTGLRRQRRQNRIAEADRDIGDRIARGERSDGQRTGIRAVRRHIEVVASEGA